MEAKEKITLLIEALKILTKDEDAKERKEIREMLARELKFF